ncbi:MAG: helix-turn-helix transcriptional regulator [Spirosomataceae bacterium]
MKNKSAFFDHRNTIHRVSEEEEIQKHDYLKPIEAFARATNSSVYVIDYMAQGFEFVSDNPLFLCGNTPIEVLALGYDYYFKYVPPKDLELLLKINDIGFSFYEKIPLNDRLNYSISYDFHLKNHLGKILLVNQKLTPLFLTNEGKIWKAICIVSVSTERTAGNIKIYKYNENKVYTYNLSTNVWEIEKKVSLTKREIEILQHSIRGLTITEIAEAIFVSPDTVKFHRKKIFEKLAVTNITEAIAYATNNGLF